MYRSQSRKFNIKSAPWIKKVAENPTDFSSVPLATMCQSIQLLINELYKRGYPVYDFDNKDKYIQGIQILQGKVFFLAASDRKEDDDETIRSTAD